MKYFLVPHVIISLRWVFLVVQLIVQGHGKWIWGFRVWCILYGAKIYAMDVPCVQRPARKAQLYRIKKEGRCLTNLSACIVVTVSGLVRQMRGKTRKRVGWCVLAENMEDIRVRRIWWPISCQILRSTILFLQP